MIQAIKAKRKFFIGAVTTAVIAVFVLNCWMDFSFQGHREGLYLLRGHADKSLLLTDDIYLGEEEEVIVGVDLQWLHDLLYTRSNQGRPHLELEWNEKEGLGYIRNYLGGDKVLMTSFSRYLDSENQYTHGLFIGGALPDALLDGSSNNSGMSYFDGERWSHIWCNTNEGIGSTISPHRYPPSTWRFLGSRIESQSAEHVVLTSHHEIDVDGVVLQMKRTIEMTAGEPDLNLTVHISNSGNGVSRYFYYYGDEPWLGNFGSAAGDIGWVAGRLVEYEEDIDPKTVDYAGMADYGSSVLGEGHNYGHVANFIQWLGPDKPNYVFIANQYDGLTNHAPKVRVPLQGDERSIGMYWGPRILAPGQNQLFSLTIGMAEHDLLTGLPKLPTHISATHTALVAANHVHKAG